MVPNHDIELAKYIDECRDKPFAWGSHDCLTFAAGCVYAQTGRATLSDMLGDYTCPMSALIHARRRIKQFDYPRGNTIPSQGFNHGAGGRSELGYRLRAGCSFAASFGFPV